MIIKSLMYRSTAILGLSLAAMTASAQTVTVFYQGMNNTQAQAARLVGKDGFIYPFTGEKVSCSRAIDCIINLTVHPEIGEVELFDPTASWFHYAIRPMTLFWLAVTRIAHWYSTIHIESTDDMPLLATASLWAHAMRVRAINLGQEGDLNEHKKRVASCRAIHPDANLVFYGVSRGSLTTFTAHAHYKYPGVKALVLEGCPNSIADVLQTSWGDIVHTLYQRYINYICAHDPHGISAMKCVEQFPHETPVLFITSEADRIVPASCTLKLVDALVKTGHPHVYCLVLKNSSHLGYAFDDPEDALNYQHVVHAFYKKYNVAGYNEAYAAAGETLLMQSHKKIF